MPSPRDPVGVARRGDTRADVTEGTPTGVGTNWERCDYDWSTPGVVVATVTDSNLYAVPGSVWELTATERSGGSRVEMTWTRKFRHTPRGILFGTAFRTVGRLLFRKYARDVIANLERLEAAGPRQRRSGRNPDEQLPQGGGPSARPSRRSPRRRIAGSGAWDAGTDNLLAVTPESEGARHDVHPSGPADGRGRAVRPARPA